VKRQRDNLISIRYRYHIFIFVRFRTLQYYGFPITPNMLN